MIHRIHLPLLDAYEPRIRIKHYIIVTNEIFLDKRKKRLLIRQKSQNLIHRLRSEHWNNRIVLE